MKFLDLLRMSSSSLWKRKVRTILTVLGVVIGTASIVVMVSLGLGLSKSTMDQIEEYGGLTTINVYESYGETMYYGGAMAVATEAGSNTQQKRLDDELVETIKAMPHVEIVSPVLNISVIAKRGSYQSYLYLQGMSIEALEKMNIELAEGTLPQKGDPLKLVYGNMVIQDFSNSKTGEGYWSTGELPDIDLMEDTMFVIFDTDAYHQSQWSDSSNPVKPPKKYVIEASGVVAGGIDEYNQHSWNTYCDVEALKTHLQRTFRGKAIPGQPTTASGKPYKELYYNSIYVSVDSMEHVQEVQEAITMLGYQASSNAEWIESEQEQMGYIQAVLGGIGAVSLFVAAIGITNTMMMSIYERTKEIGIMKVLGCDLRNIQGMFLLEAGYIGFIGGVIGLILSLIISFVINKVVATAGLGMSTLSYIPVWLAILSIVFAVLIGMLAGFFPALRAMKLSPLAAIRNE